MSPVVYDNRRRIFTLVVPCRQCGRSVYWTYDGANRRRPFDLDEQGLPTRVIHSFTCPKRRTPRP